jgi:hypothetical protein
MLTAKVAYSRKKELYFPFYLRKISATRKGTRRFHGRHGVSGTLFVPKGFVPHSLAPSTSKNMASQPLSGSSSRGDLDVGPEAEAAFVLTRP